MFVAECEQKVAEEVPDGGDAYGKRPKDVESPVFGPRGEQSAEQPEAAVVNAQAYYGDKDEFDVFHADLFFLAAECPDAVEDIVARGGGNESDRVGDERIHFGQFLKQKEQAAMDDHAACSDYAEFYEFQQ